MIKGFYFVLLLGTVFFFVACGNSDGQSDTLPEFSILIISGESRLYTINSQVMSEFHVYKIKTSRTIDGRNIKERWRGIKLSDVIEKYEYTDATDIEILTTDHLTIRMSKDEVTQYDPLIATHRNGKKIDREEFPLVGTHLPNRFWVSKIHRISPIKMLEVQEPNTIMTFHTALQMIRFHHNPYPYENVFGFRLWDIVSLFSHTSDTYIRIVTKDGIEQTWQFQKYLKDAILAVDEEKFHLQSISLPSTMWLNDIMLIHVNDGIILFYDNVDFLQNEKYKQFIELISRRERTAIGIGGRRTITDWEEIKWDDINILE